MINLKSNLDEYELSVLANFEQNDFWQLLKKIVGVELETLENEIRRSPRFSDDDLTEDLRFKMGGVDRLKWVIELPEEARNLLTKR